MYVLAQDSGFEAGFERSLEEFAQLLPKIGYFLLILIVGAILAKFVAKILTTVLQRVGFDKLVERGGVKKAMASSKYDAAGILGKIVYYFIFLLVLSAAFSVFGPNPVSDFLAQIIAFLPNIFVAVLVLVIAAAVAAALKELISSMLGGLSYGNALANAVSLFVIALGVFFALDQLQIAPDIVNGLFYALLALIVLPLIIAFGVGGIEPAREVIQDMRAKARDKAQEVEQEARSQPEDSELEGEPSAPVRRTRATATRATTRATATRRRPTA
ncbi:MAG: mechanosensitive ion channel family protein [Actinomycetes bacterium]